MSGGGLHVARMGVLDQHSTLVGIRRGYSGRGSVGIKDRNLEFGCFETLVLKLRMHILLEASSLD